jgi:hypothetical protein
MPRSDGTNGAYETHGTHETSLANPISLATRSAFGVRARARARKVGLGWRSVGVLRLLRIARA